MASNSLRDEHGGLIGGLVVEDYNQGIVDFENGTAPPEMTTPSYDLGRQRAAEKVAAEAEVQRWLERQREITETRLKAVLTPEQYAEYRANVDRFKGSPR